MSLIQEIVIAARNIRAEMKVDPKKKDHGAIFPAESPYVRSSRDLTISTRFFDWRTLQDCAIASQRLDPAGAAIRSTANYDTRESHTSEAVDKQTEIARLKKEIERLAKDIESKKARLADETFLSKAPAKIVEDLKATLAAREIEHQKLRDRLSQLQQY